MLSNTYIAEKVAHERIRDYQRQARRDHQAILAGQATTTTARDRNAQLPRQHWVARVAMAIVSMFP